MSKRLRLADIRPGTAYTIDEFDTAGAGGVDNGYAEKLTKMGFVSGTRVELAQVKIADPMVVRIRGSRIALRKYEARGILVTEV